MPRKRRNRKPQRRPVHTRPERGDPYEEQGLIQDLRRAMRSEEPIDLLSLASGLLEATDTRNRNPFSQGDTTTREELLESFIGAPFAETTAVLMVLRSLIGDEVTKARITGELANRRHPMPPWLTGLEDAVSEPQMFLLTHVLNDGDDYLLGVRLPTGQCLSALVYVDTNMGTVVKDAFVVPEALEDLVIKLGSLAKDPDQSLMGTDPANGRAEVEQAIARSAMLWPPLESDEWPLCRPLVEWMLRHLPEGGEVADQAEWSDEQIAEIAHAFFASPFGRRLDREDERSLMESILRFATSYTGGDPYRWSNVRVEVLLEDWFPRKIVAPTAYLAKMPAVLRAYVRYCHDRQGIRANLTGETLAAIDHHEPEYQRLIRSEREQGAEALLTATLGARPDLDEMTLEEIVLSGLDAEVGGRMRLQALDDAPLPDEPFEWAGIPEDIHPVVQEMLDACDRFADDLDDVEYRTAMRRFLSRAAAGGPMVFRRRGSAVRGAAAVAWVISQANELFTAKSSKSRSGSAPASPSGLSRCWTRSVWIRTSIEDPCGSGLPTCCCRLTARRSSSGGIGHWPVSASEPATAEQALAHGAAWRESNSGPTHYEIRSGVACGCLEVCKRASSVLAGALACRAVQVVRCQRCCHSIATVPAQTPNQPQA